MCVSVQVGTQLGTFEKEGLMLQVYHVSRPPRQVLVCLGGISHVGALLRLFVSAGTLYVQCCNAIFQLRPTSQRVQSDSRSVRLNTFLFNRPTEKGLLGLWAAWWSWIPWGNWRDVLKLPALEPHQWRLGFCCDLLGTAAFLVGERVRSGREEA